MAEQDSTPYVDALLAYAERDPGRFQVPGHKGGPGADPAMRELVGEAGLRNDIPSVTEGVDIGPEPTPFQQAQLLAAEAWGARRTWFLINGASQGNHATCMALAHVGDRVVVQRNVHSSVIDGLVLSGMRPTFVAPELDPELGIAHGLTPDSLAAALDADPGRGRGDGRLPHLLRRLRRRRRAGRGRARARRAAGRRRGLGRAPALPSRAAAGRARERRRPRHLLDPQDRRQPHPGGDAPPRRGGRIDPAVVDRCVSLVETTSPSGLLSGSLDAARRQAWSTAPSCSARPWRRCATRARRSREIPGLEVLDERHGRPRRGRRLGPAAARDRRARHRLHRLPPGQALLDDDDIDLELYSENVVVAIFGLGEPAAPPAERLVAALREAVEHSTRARPPETRSWRRRRPGASW